MDKYRNIIDTTYTFYSDQLKNVFNPLIYRDFVNVKFVEDFYKIVNEDYIEKYNNFIIR